VLKIGIETGDLLRLHRAGMARYTSCLLSALEASPFDAEITAWAPWRRLVGWPLRPSRSKLRFFGKAAPRVRPDIFHATACVFPPWKSSIEISTVHDLFAIREELNLPPEEVRRRTAYAGRADLIICPSRFTQSQVHLLLGIPASRTMVVAHAVDSNFKPAEVKQKLRLRRRHGLPSEFLLFVGRDRLNKNLDRLIKAYAQSGLELPLYIAGSQSKMARERLTTLAQQSGCEHSLRWLGAVSDAELPVLLSCASAVCLPSTFEGFGLPILEAMACGTAVVTSLGHATEEVADGRAVLVDPLSVESIAEGLREVLHVSESQKAEARSFATRRTWRDAAEETWCIYQNAAQGSPSAESAGVRKWATDSM
jgi:alpha-1,3-rhamnosyl/mannosyltransferase